MLTWKKGIKITKAIIGTLALLLGALWGVLMVFSVVASFVVCGVSTIIPIYAGCSALLYTGLFTFATGTFVIVFVMYLFICFLYIPIVLTAWDEQHIYG